MLFNRVASAQSSEVFFEHFTVDDGLSQSSVNCIIQGKKGFLWLGTQDGLNKYDGYKFKYYQNNPLDTNSLSGNWVYTIDTDNSDIVWIGTNNGLNKLYQHADKIKRYIANPKNPNALFENEIFGVLVDKRGNVWIKTASTLSMLDTATDVITRHVHDTDPFGTNRSDKGFPLLEDKDGIWVGSGYGLMFYSFKDDQFKYYYNIPEDRNSISNDFITGLDFDNKGNLWVGTHYGLNKFDKKKKTFKHYFHDFTESGGLSANSISKIIVGHDGILWITTDGGGLNKFNPITETFEVYKTQSNNDNSLSYDYLNCVFEDKSHILYIGTDGTGMDKLDLKPKKFKLIRNSNSVNSINLSENVIGAIYDDDKKIWIGTWDKGLDLIDKKTYAIEHFTDESQIGKRIQGNNIHAIIKDSRNLVWIGTNSGISIYDYKTNKFSNAKDYFKYENYPTLNNRIYCIIEDKKNNIWVGTQNGLHCFDVLNKNYKSYTSDINDTLSLFDNHIISLMCDINGNIWIGTQAGLNMFNYQSNKFFRIGSANNYSAKNKNTYFKISNTYIYEILEDKVDGSIWIGTASGLNRYNPKTGTFQYFTVRDGLPNETIYEIKQDKDNNIWMSTNRGIAKLNRKTFEIRGYDKSDGLQGLEFNNGASFISEQGEIYFGGTNGFNSFNPKTMYDNPFIPDVFFISFEKINSNNIKEPFNIENTTEIELSYSDHSLFFYFSALEYTQPKKNSYKYLIEGLNNDWIYIGNKNFIELGTLAPGNYTLKVKGSNNDLKWSDKVISIHIIVNPPFFKSIYAYLLYILIIISIVLWYVKSRTKKLTKVNEALKVKQLAALEIAKQREELSVKNKNIMDSINYAKRIQEAMLPSEYLFRKLLPDSFIFYKPKDVVSGDFYWVTEKENKIFIAAVDCTGHGVPGAFMSIIGFDLLRNITKEQGVENPSQILNLLNLGISETFSKHANESSIKDGMDVSLLVIDRNLKKLEYSGAFNPLYIARNNKIIDIKGNRFAVGKIEGNESLKFDNHVIEYLENDMIYIFSDGYADQFGGPLGKKFKFRRFRHLLLTICSLSLNKQRNFLEENFDSWKGQLEQVDDILVIGIKL